MAEIITLLPCPFDGAPADFWERNGVVAAGCTRCGVRTDVWHNEERAAADWNRRAVDAPAGVTREQIAAALYVAAEREPSAPWEDVPVAVRRRWYHLAEAVVATIVVAGDAPAERFTAEEREALERAQNALTGTAYQPSDQEEDAAAVLDRMLANPAAPAEDGVALIAAEREGQKRVAQEWRARGFEDLRGCVARHRDGLPSLGLDDWVSRTATLLDALEWFVAPEKAVVRERVHAGWARMRMDLPDDATPAAEVRDA